MKVTVAEPTVTVSPAASPRVVFPLSVLGPATVRNPETVALEMVQAPRVAPPTVPMVAAPVLRKVPVFVIPVTEIAEVNEVVELNVTPPLKTAAFPTVRPPASVLDAPALD